MHHMRRMIFFKNKQPLPSKSASSSKFNIRLSLDVYSMTPITRRLFTRRLSPDISVYCNIQYPRTY